MRDQVEQQAVFQAIADPTRREIMRLLVDSELSITAIARRFPITRTAVNKHLHVLSGAGLLHCRRAGRETLYTFEPDPLYKVHQWLSYYEEYWEDRLEALRRYVEPDVERK